MHRHPPTAADPGVTSVTVTGRGFPSGTILPADVTVTLKPAGAGGAPSGNTPATKVTVVSGTEERIAFVVPASIAVTTATSYVVSIVGSTSTGGSFASKNSASLTVNAPVAITTASQLPTGTVATNYVQSLTASGGSGVYTWAVSSGTLPGGLSLNSATGVIGGQPTKAGSSRFGIKVTDSLHLPATKAFALTIDAALSITTGSPLPTGTVGVTYAQTLAATGGSGSYTWSVSAGSSLPGGLSLESATGQIGGQPTKAGPASFTVQVTDTNQVTTTKPFTMTINPALLITTTSPLPAATVSTPYSQTFAASGGSGGYNWSATGLPAWLTLSTAGALTGIPPLTALNSTFTVKVTDSLNDSTSASFTAPVTLAIMTTSPLPAGQVGINYSQTLAAAGGAGGYVWAVTAGTWPGGLSLNSSTGLISGQPTAAIGANFTIQVTDAGQATVVQPFAIAINPAASIQTLSPNSSNAGLFLQVSITGSYTHFVQGTTMANFGPGIAVGGAAAGQPGPVTVTGATSATAQIAINASAAAGSQTVTVTTGSEQATLVNGFSIQAAIPYISLNTTTSTPLAHGFSGFDDEYLINGVGYWDPKYLAMVEPLKAGWIRFPSGSPSMAFDWQTGYLNQSWIAELEPDVISFIYEGLVRSQELTQAKCGSQFAKYGTFLQTVGANGLVVVNGFTDTNANSAGKLVTAAQKAGLNILDWELDNEAYCCPKWFASPSAYLKSAYNPYYEELIAADPNAPTGVFYEGQFAGLPNPPYNYQAWDTGMSAYGSPYWQTVTYHVYPILDESITTVNEEQTLNGFLAHGTTEYFDSYIQPLIGTTAPVFISEVNSDGYATLAFESYLYNAVFLAEFLTRMSTVPQVKAVGVTELYLGNSFNQGVIRAVNDHETYLIEQVAKNPSFCTDTSTNPLTQFSFYYSTNALALEIANLAINFSNGTWPTTLTGGPTVPIQGYDGNPVPAIFAQGYQGTDGTHYVLITNKSGSSVPMAIEVNGSLLEQSVTVSYISNASDTAQNTATSQNSVQIVTTTSANPITVGPYSVTRVQW